MWTGRLLIGLRFTTLLTLRRFISLNHQSYSFLIGLIFDPLTVRHINRPRITAPWITPAIHGLIKLKSRSLRRYQRSRDQSNWQRFKTLRNLANSAIYKEKRSFFDCSLSNISRWQFWRNFSYLGDHCSSNINIPEHLHNPDVLNSYFIDSLPSNTSSSLSSIHLLQTRYELAKSLIL